MLMMKLLVEWEEVHRVEENEAVYCAEILSPVEGVGEEDVEEKED